ncbi:MAG: tRNA-dihydrouridine synthase family protein, partial [Proteobacteria bacterium]|nr:tRNA-dihydrouridine synthase family protein [Pseudomonadota bacterium]
MFAPINLKNLTIKTPVFAAPMAGITDWPTRQILRKCAPSAPIVTEMISSHSLIENRKKILKTNNNRNFDNYATETLIGAQIFGADPKIMAIAAKILEQNGAAWIDINMGCPVPKVATRAGAGAFLMRDHKLAGQIVASVVASVKIPVSVKTRLGWDASHLDSAELVRIAADSGAGFVAIHGRTRAAGYAGTADWRQIAAIKEQLKNFPIIFNGDIKSQNDIDTVEKLGADGAMIGRALLGNPMLLGKLTNTTHVPAFAG